MIVFNNTIKVHYSIVDEWVKWQLQEYVPGILATGAFDDYKLYRLLNHDDEEGITYTIQFFTSSVQRYQQYLETFAPAMQEKAFQKWGNLFIGFHTAMQLVN